MTWVSFIENGLMEAADAIVGHVRQPRPSRGRLAQCKIISHRGERLGTSITENTIAAFSRAAAAGVWGIEMDLHWTGNGEPVVFHDADLYRLYGIRRKISAYSFAALRNQFPAIPTLAEVVAQYGGKVHLMIEIKTAPKPAFAGRPYRLQEILEHLAPAADYHLLSLRPERLCALTGIPESAFVAVAGRLPHGLSRWVLDRRWGGLCGHYALIGNSLIRRHHARGQKIGIGYARSRNSLFRELNRGVDWVFTNHANALQSILERALHKTADSDGS